MTKGLNKIPQPSICLENYCNFSDNEAWIGNNKAGSVTLIR